jgi:RNA polymerase sigma-54 factor
MSALRLEVTQKYEQHLWPGLVALARLLPLPIAGLEAFVDQAVAENPALEREPSREAHCPDSCGWCRGNGAPSGTPDRALELASRPRGGVLADARVLLSPREGQLAEYILSSLDARGLLTRSLAEIAGETGATDEELQTALAALRSVGPASLAAHDLREALLLQLDAMGEAAPDLARRLVEGHLNDLATGAYARAAGALGVTRAEVVEARDFIRARLEPPRCETTDQDAVPAPRPDLVIGAVSTGELHIDVPEVRHVRVRLDPIWKQLAEAATTPPEEQALARELLARARALMQRLEDRRRTLSDIAQYTVWRQERYARGTAPPIPLTRAAVARGVGVHESTVSRAVSGKLVQLASGRTVQFASFFHAALGAEHALARLIATEQRPRSDEELARELGRLGYPLARRTVTKYRDRLGIVPYLVR